MSDSRSSAQDRHDQSREDPELQVLDQQQAGPEAEECVQEEEPVPEHGEDERRLPRLRGGPSGSAGLRRLRLALQQAVADEGRLRALPGFANARSVRQAFEEAQKRQANRLVRAGALGDPRALHVLEAADLG